MKREQTLVAVTIACPRTAKKRRLFLILLMDMRASGEPSGRWASEVLWRTCICEIKSQEEISRLGFMRSNVLAPAFNLSTCVGLERPGGRDEACCLGGCFLLFIRVFGVYSRPPALSKIEPLIDIISISGKPKKLSMNHWATQPTVITQNMEKNAPIRMGRLKSYL